MNKIISQNTIINASQLNDNFTNAKYFPNTPLENFFDNNFCQNLLKEFPSFEERFAKNEYGKVGTKACVEDFANIGPHYKLLDECIQSKEFLDLLSEITGIPDLLYDPEYFGGGTHENINNAELDPHVDFNFHPNTNWHRRLNLIIFLNEGWKDEWGGVFEVHQNPWNKEDNEINQISPLFNNGVIFETNEYSWHGFNKITLPENKTNVSRKSIALYFYTEERPDSETAASHGTIYVPRKLPDEIKPNETLSQDNYDLIKVLLKRRDDQIRYLYGRELIYSKEIQTLSSALKKCILPISGKVKVIGNTEGMYHDKWVSEELSFSVEPEIDIKSFTIVGWLPEHINSLIIEVQCGEFSIKKEIESGQFEFTVEVPVKAQQVSKINLKCKNYFTPSSISDSDDIRKLSFIMKNVIFNH